MLFKKFSILIIFLTILFTTQPKAWGYNFLYINPTTGAPIGWEPGTTIHYYVDPGPLGRLTNEQARTLIRAAMDVWENASPYADVPTFEYAGLLTEDVTGENYGQYVDLVGCYSDSISLCPTQTQKDLKTVIVFDEQGTILSRELCEIGSCNAYADAGVFSGSASNPGNFVQAFAVFGPLLGRSSTPITAVVATMVHELGHVLGLAHASVNQEIYIHGSTSMARYIPTMFFSAISGTRDPSNITLNPDDIAGITALYPTGRASTQLGAISGQILKSDGNPMMHVNVVARNEDDPLCETFSYLSGRVCPEGYERIGGNTCFRSSTDVLYATSNYTLSDLPTGDYYLEVEEIADNDIARTFAPGLADPYIYGDAEFWNTSDAADELSALKTSISLTSGVTREGINITLNRNEVTTNRIKYIPLSTFTPGLGTRCLENPTIDYAAMIGISEAGTSGSDNSGSGGSSVPPHFGGCSLVLK